MRPSPLLPVTGCTFAFCQTLLHSPCSCIPPFFFWNNQKSNDHCFYCSFFHWWDWGLSLLNTPVFVSSCFLRWRQRQQTKLLHAWFCLALYDRNAVHLHISLLFIFDVVSMRGKSFPWLLARLRDLLLSHYHQHDVLMSCVFCIVSKRKHEIHFHNKLTGICLLNLVLNVPPPLVSRWEALFARLQPEWRVEWSAL